MNEHEVLVKARNLLDRDGWTQGRFGDVGGPYCARGALVVAAGAPRPATVPPSRHCGALNSAYHLLQLIVGVETIGADWNDTPGRTKEEVLAAFDAAIAETAPPPEDIPLPDPLNAGVPA